MNKILFCAELCRATYNEKALNSRQAGDLRYLIREVDGVTFCAIRGTANATNGIRDVRAWPVRSTKGFLAHAGFVKGQNEVVEAIGRPPPGTIFTGHSLGGAVATLLAERFGGELVTFGSPRVYMRWFGAPKLDHTRIVMDDDPVPDVPGILYTHYSEATVLKDSDSSVVDIKDHFIDSYINRLTRQ